MDVEAMAQRLSEMVGVNITGQEIRNAAIGARQPLETQGVLVEDPRNPPLVHEGQASSPIYPANPEDVDVLEVLAAMLGQGI